MGKMEVSLGMPGQGHVIEASQTTPKGSRRVVRKSRSHGPKLAALPDQKPLGENAPVAKQAGVCEFRPQGERSGTAQKPTEGTPSDRTQLLKSMSSLEDTCVLPDGVLGVLGHKGVVSSQMKEWLRFDARMKGARVRIFADSGASTCYLAKRIVDRLGLEVTPSNGRIQLEGGKTIPVLGTVRAYWSKDDFSIVTKFIVLDIAHDVILGQDFWIQTQLAPDYNSLGIHVTKDDVSFHLHGLELENLQILQEVPQEANIVGRHAFRRMVRKNQAKPHLFVLRDESPVLEPTQRSTGNSRLDAYLGPLLNVFMSDLPMEPPPERPQDHTIDTGDARPVNKSPYSLSKEQLDEQKRQIEYLLERNLIRPSTSPWGAPVLFAKKKDGTWRMCIDYRALNDITVRNGYPLPKIQDCLIQIGKAKCFSKIDLLSGYWQIGVAEKDRLKTVFNTRTGKYEFCVMPFGLTNAPATFQGIMNDLLRDFLDDFVVVYLDDILIYSNSDEEHLEHVKKVMQRLQDAKLYARPSKCCFMQKTVEFCGHIVGNGEVKMDAAKVKTITEWPRPQTNHDLRSFLGLCAYYRRFLQDYAAIASPLYDLIQQFNNRPNQIVRFNYAAVRAYECLKRELAGHTVLAQPDVNRPFLMETDASDFGWGAILIQVGEDGKEHPIAFESKRFSPAERNYATYERELLAIKEGLRRWRCYIENGHVTTVRTDHASLQYLKTSIKPSGRLARWLAEFGEYKLDIKYKPGKEMIVADTLSRRSDYQLRTMTFDEAVVAYAKDGSLSGDEVLDSDLQRFEGQLKFEDDRVYYRDSEEDTYVPYLEHWARSDFLNKVHNDYGHVADKTMMDIIRVRQWWPDMRRDIKHFVRYCSACQLAAKPREVSRDVMHPSHTWHDKSQPFERWGLDLIGTLPKTDKGNRWIVTAIDYSTRWPVAVAIPEATSEALADFVVHHIYKNYGAPAEIITDRGANLWATAMKLVLEKLGTRHRGTTPYHPRTNGAVERFNGVLGEMLTKYMIGHPIKEWDQYLDQALFATRIRTHATTKFSPFYLLYGVNPKLPGDEVHPTPDQYDERIDPAPFLSKERATAFQATMAKAIENKKRWDAKVNEKTKFAVGDWVLIQTKKPNKFEAPWYGPYMVIRAEWLNTYILRAPSGKKNEKYLISGDRMKKARVEGNMTRGWKLPKGPGRPRKAAEDEKYNARESQHAVVTRPLDDFVPLPDVEQDDGGEQTV